jgi:hypothetical protein
MKRLLAATALAAAALAPVSAHASSLPSPGGQCEGTIDFNCRTTDCHEDELDCGLIPPCTVWVNGACLVW